MIDINIEMHRTCFDMHILAQQGIDCTPKSSHAPDSPPYWSSTCHMLSVDQHGTEKSGSFKGKCQLAREEHGVDIMGLALPCYTDCQWYMKLTTNWIT